MSVTPTRKHLRKQCNKPLNRLPLPQAPQPVVPNHGVEDDRGRGWGRVELPHSGSKWAASPATTEHPLPQLSLRQPQPPLSPPPAHLWGPTVTRGGEGRRETEKPTRSRPFAPFSMSAFPLVKHTRLSLFDWNLLPCVYLMEGRLGLTSARQSPIITIYCKVYLPFSRAVNSPG